jgi:hypothetical protein
MVTLPSTILLSRRNQSHKTQLKTEKSTTTKNFSRAPFPLNEMQKGN